MVSTPAPVQPTPSEEPKLIEIKTPGLSEAEQKKLDELRRLKEQAKLKKQTTKKQTDDLPALKADALPPVMMQRKG